MKVLHFYRTSIPDSMGGIEQAIHQIACGCEKHGIASDVLSLSRTVDQHKFLIKGYTSHRAKLDFQIASTGFSFSAFSKFSSLAREADVLHYHFPWPFMDLVHFINPFKKPAVVTYHSDIIRQKLLLKLYQPLKHRFLGHVERIVATSPNYFSTSDVLKRYADKVSIIPLGIDKDTYPATTPERLGHWQRRLGDKFFLFVGVLRYYKGLHILMQAAQGTHYPIVIVGAGLIEDELKAQCQQLGLAHIHFLGHLSDDDKIALLTLCYGVVFPSHLRSEAFGISLLEGAMFGKPMISSEIGTGTTFINIANETGLVVPPSDPIALRAAMRYLWEYPEVAAAFGRRAEERYWAHFTADQMSAAYARLYREMVSR